MKLPFSRAGATVLLASFLAASPVDGALAAEMSAREPSATNAGCTSMAESCQAAGSEAASLDAQQKAQLGELATRAALADSSAFAVLRALRQSSMFSAVPDATPVESSPRTGGCRGEPLFDS